jgi:dienelactone hydrolase
MGELYRRMDPMNPKTTDGRPRRSIVAFALLAPMLALLGACSKDPAGVDTVSYLDEVYHFDVQNDIAYGAAPNENGLAETLLLDLFQPTDDTQPLRPAVIWLHGGSFQEGNKGEMTLFTRRFAQRGFVTATVNYRLRESSVFDYTDPTDSLGEVVKRDAQHDVQAAVRWLRSQASQLRIDPAQIYVVGYSSGGTTALRVAAWPDDFGTSGNPGGSSTVAGVVSISGHLDTGVLEAISGSALLIHGTMDTKTPVASVQAACSAQSRCQLFTVAGATHSMITPERETIITETALFLNRQVTGQ